MMALVKLSAAATSVGIEEASILSQIEAVVVIYLQTILLLIEGAVARYLQSTVYPVLLVDQIKAPHLTPALQQIPLINVRL